MADFPAANAISTAANQGAAKTDFEDFLAATKQIPGAGVAEQAVTIASGVLTPADGASGIISMDTEGGAATDDLTNMTNTNIPDGSERKLRCTSSARVIVVKHSAGGAGQFSLKTAGDFTLGDPTHWLLVKRTGAVFEEIARFPQPMSAVVTRTSNTKIVAADIGKVIDITSGTFTQTYEACAGLGTGWWIAIRNSGSGIVTHDPNASETLDGATTLAQNPGDQWLIVCDGSNLKTFSTNAGLETGTWSADLDPGGSATRALDTVYQNTSGKKRRVSVGATGLQTAANRTEVFVGSGNPPTISLGQGGPGGSGPATNLHWAHYFEVPNGWYYKVISQAGSPSLDNWNELDE